MRSVLTARGQVTIPKEVRVQLGLKPGDRVKFFFDANGRLALLPQVPITAAKGIVPARGKRASLADMDEAIAKGIVARFKRTSKR